MSRTYEQLEPVISALDNRISAKAEQIDALDTRVTAVEGDIDETNERLGELKSAFNDTTGCSLLNLTGVGYIDTSVASVDVTDIKSGNYVHGVFSCSEGDVFTILQGSGGYTPRLWCFIDASGNSLTKSNTELTVETEYRIVAPANADRVIFNCRTAHAVIIYKGLLCVSEIEITQKETESIKDSIYYETEVDIPLKWVQGGLNPSDGTENTDDYLVALRTGFFTVQADRFTVKPNTNFRILVFYYDSNKDYISRTAVITSETEVQNNYSYYRMQVTNTSRPGSLMYLTDIYDLGKFTSMLPIVEKGEFLGENVNCVATSSESGYIYYVNGVVMPHQSYRYVELDVLPGMNVVFRTTTNDNAGLCFYDSNGVFIPGSGHKSTTTIQKIVAPADAAKCKATIYNSTRLKDVILVLDPQWISSEFKSVPNKNRYSDKIGNYADPVITLDTSEFVNGYVANDGTVVTDNSYRLSPMIPVYEGCYITFTKVTTATWTICSWYNANGEYVGRCPNPHNANETLDSYTVQVPYGIKYMRYVCAPVHLSITNVEYVESTIPHDYKISNLVNGWYNQAFGENTKLFAKATAQPLITIIDDDTGNSETVGKFYNACKAQGIIGNFAVITSRYLNNDSTLEQTLLDYESEGFGILTHCTLQDSKWANHEYNLIREDITACLRQLRKSGFINYMYWAYPGGIDNVEMQQIAKELGFKCGISSGLNSIETTQYHSGGRYRLKRCSLDPVDGESHLTVARFKELIDELVACNGWLIITTHFWQDEWTPEVIAERFDAIVDYAQDKGVKFTTIGEAWEIKRHIYDYYDMF